MKFILHFYLLVYLCNTAIGQTITIRDKETGEPIEFVTLSSKKPKASARTNEKGQTNITLFQSADSIFIRHISYKELITSYSQIASQKFEIELISDNISIRQVIISNSRWDKNKLETPSRIEKLNMKEVAFQNPQTTADLLGTSGYAFIQKSQLGGGSPMLRGMATNRVLLVVDGVRMNNAVFRSGNLQNVISLDANALESTEILFGPGSVKYGSDAIGGVMDFKTLEPKYVGLNDSKFIFLGNAMMRTSTANSEKAAHVDLNFGCKKLVSVTSFSRADYGDLRSGSVGGNSYFYRPYYVQTIDNKDYMVFNPDSTLQIGSKFNQTNFMQKVRYKPNSFLEIDYGFHLSETSPYNRYDRLYVVKLDGPYKNKLRWAEWYYGPQKWNMHRIGLNYTKASKVFDQIRFIGALQNFEESRYDREFMVRELQMQKENVKAYSFNLDFDKKLNHNMSISYGAEWVHNTVSSVASLTHVVTKEVTPTVTRYPDGSTWQSYGAYLSMKYQLTPKIGINGGARYTYYKIMADFDTTFFPFPFTNALMKNGTLNGSLGFVYSPTQSWQLYLNGASGFRAPNIDDMGKVFESTPGYLVVPNPDLKPERAYNAELGGVKTFGRYLKLDFACYYTLLKDAMVRRDFLLNGESTIRYQGNKSIIQAVQNVTKIKVYGIQAGLEFYFKGIGLKSSISYQNGKEQSPDSLIYYPLRHAAPLFGSTHLTYTGKMYKFDLYAVYNGKMDYEDLALTERINASYARNENGQPYSAAWTTLNFKAAFYANKFVALSLGVENIFDKMYRPYSSGINASGRNFIASLKARF